MAWHPQTRGVVCQGFCSRSPEHMLLVKDQQSLLILVMGSVRPETSRVSCLPHPHPSLMMSSVKPETETSSPIPPQHPIPHSQPHGEHCQDQIQKLMDPFWLPNLLLVLLPTSPLEVSFAARSPLTLPLCPSFSLCVCLGFPGSFRYLKSGVKPEEIKTRNRRVVVNKRHWGA